LERIQGPRPPSTPWPVRREGAQCRDRRTQPSKIAATLREREMNVLVVDVFKSPEVSLSKTRPKMDILRVRYQSQLPNTDASDEDTSHADRLNLADESLPTRHISSNAIGFGLPPLTSGVQHHTVPMQFTSANPGASASWSHISCPVAPYQWTHSAPLTLATLAPSWPNEPYQTQFHEPPPGINLPPIGDLVDNRCWRNPSGPRQYSGSGMRVLHVRSTHFLTT
jgi:hypothetical protein